MKAITSLLYLCADGEGERNFSGGSLDKIFDELEQVGMPLRSVIEAANNTTLDDAGLCNLRTCISQSGLHPPKQRNAEALVSSAA